MIGFGACEIKKETKEMVKEDTYVEGSGFWKKLPNTEIIMKYSMSYESNNDLLKAVLNKHQEKKKI